MTTAPGMKYSGSINMAKRICIIRHITREGPGRFHGLIKKRGLDIHQYDLSQSLTLPDPAQYDGVLVMGGPQSANDTDERMTVMRDFVSGVLDSGTPYIGICLGMQLLVKAAGGQVVKSPRKEIGFFDPQKRPYENILTREGKKDPLLRGLADRFPVFHLHGETVVLTPEIGLLATAPQCPNQIIRVNQTAYGLQGHPELNASMLDIWLREEPWLRESDPGEIKRQYRTLEPGYARVSEALIRNWPV